MYPILFKIGPLTIYSWGTMVALAFLLGIALALWLAKREGVAPERVIDLTIYILIAAIIGSRLFYVIQFWSEFKDNPLEIIMVHRGGLVFYGGLIAVILAVILYTWLNKLSLLKILDIATLPAALGYTIGRIGCFLNGCCYGIETNLPWAIAGKHPTQIYASLAGLLIFCILASWWWRRKFEGQIFFSGITFYSIYRFLIEFVRYNPTHYLGLSVAQIISIAGFFAGMSGLWILWYQKNQPAKG